MNDYLKHRQDHINKGRPLPEKKKYTIPRESAKMKARKAEQRLSGQDSEMDLFFEAMRHKMTGRCIFCHCKSERDNDETFRSSIAHLLPKRDIKQGGFPSVGTHEDNWIELCWSGENDCHTNFDRGSISWYMIKDSAEWLMIREKLLNVLPAVAPEERKHKLYSKLSELVYGKK